MRFIRTKAIRGVRMDNDLPRIRGIESLDQETNRPGKNPDPGPKIGMEPEAPAMNDSLAFDTSKETQRNYHDSGEILPGQGGSDETLAGPKTKKKRKWVGRFFVSLFVLALAFAAGAGGYYYYKTTRQPETAPWSQNNKEQDFTFTEKSGLTHKFPEELPFTESPEFLKALNMFKSGYMEAARTRFQEVVESSASPEEKSYSLVFLGGIADDDGKYRLALDYYQRAIKFMPENFYAHYNMALTYRHMGKYLEAIDELKIAKKINPDLIDISVLQGEMQYEMSDLPGAQETLEGIVQKNKDAMAFYNLGLVYKKEGKLAQAKAAFIQALEAPGSPEAVFKSAAQLGLIFGIQGDYQNAIVYMKRAVQLQPKNPKYLYNLALLQQKAGDTEGALVSLRESAKYGDENPQTYIYISQLYELLGKNKHAEEAMLQARDAAPLDIEILQRLADIQIKNAAWDDATQTLKKILQIATRSFDRSRALYNLGKVYTEIGDYKNAEDTLSKARQIDYTNEDILLTLGNLYHLEGDSHRTIELYREALKVNPDSVPILKALGVLYYKLQLYTEAEQTFRRLVSHPLKNEEDVHFAYHAIGKILKSRGKFDDAITYFEKSNKSSDMEMQFNSLLEMADCYLEANRPSLFAIEALEKAISLQPARYEARTLLARALMRDGAASARQRAEEELSMVIELARDPHLLSRAHTLRGIIYYTEGFYLRSIDDFNIALEFDPANQEAFQNKKAAAQKIENEY